MSVPREQPPFDPYHTWLGIPPDQQPANRYRLLGLELFESDADVIDVAANRQVAYLRQVGVGDHQSVAKQLIEEIAAARRFLLDTPSREAYDQQFQAATSTPPIRDRSPSIVIDASSPRAAKTESHRRSSKPQPDRSTRRKRQRTIMMSGAAVLTAIVVVGGGYLASRDTPAAGSIPRTADRSGAVAAQPVVSDTRSARPAPQRSASTNVSSSNTSSISEAFDRKFQAAQQAALAPQKPPTAKPVAAAKPKSDVARAKTDLSSESPLPIVVDFESDSWRDALTIDATEAFDKHHLVRDGKLLVLQSDDTSFYGAAMRLRVAALRPGDSVSVETRIPKGLKKNSGIVLQVADFRLIFRVDSQNKILVRTRQNDKTIELATVDYESDPKGLQIPYCLRITCPTTDSKSYRWRIVSPSGSVAEEKFHPQQATGADNVLILASRYDARNSHFWIDNIRCDAPLETPSSATPVSVTAD